MSFEVKLENLIPSLERVYNNYGEFPNQSNIQEKLKLLAIRIVNSIKHLFDKSDWQIANKQLSIIFFADGHKNSDRFKGIIFPGLRENVFTEAESRQIADRFLKKFIKAKTGNFEDDLTQIHKNVEFKVCTGKILYHKAVKNPEMFPDLKLNDDEFTRVTRREQLGMVYDASNTKYDSFYTILSKIVEGEKMGTYTLPIYLE